MIAQLQRIVNGTKSGRQRQHEQSDRDTVVKDSTIPTIPTIPLSWFASRRQLGQLRAITNKPQVGVGRRTSHDATTIPFAIDEQSVEQVKSTSRLSPGLRTTADSSYDAGSTIIGDSPLHASILQWNSENPAVGSDAENIILRPISHESSLKRPERSETTTSTEEATITSRSEAFAPLNAVLSNEKLELELSSPRLRLVGRYKGKNSYCAADSTLRPAIHTQERFSRDIIQRLGIDLKDVQSKLRKKAGMNGAEDWETNIFFELRMSGCASSNAKTVSLCPTIWILCGSKWACLMVEKEVEAYTWTDIPIEVHYESIGPASAPDVTDMSRLELSGGIEIADGVLLCWCANGSILYMIREKKSPVERANDIRQ